MSDHKVITGLTVWKSKKNKHKEKKEKNTNLLDNFQDTSTRRNNY
jgi:hypothetical protein